jgi:hypothetical protein
LSTILTFEFSHFRILNMRALCVLIILALVSLSSASPSVPQGRKANYFYFELVPKEKLVLTFKADKICAKDVDKISVNEFDSEAKYPATETKGKVPVRIKNIFVESFSPCSNHPVGKLEKKLVVGPFAKQMTHIRVTTSEGIEVSQAGE